MKRSQPFRIPQGEATICVFTFDPEFEVSGGIVGKLLRFVMVSGIDGTTLSTKLSSNSSQIEITGAQTFLLKFTSDETIDFPVGRHLYDIFCIDSGVETEYVRKSVITVDDTVNY